MDNWTHTLIGLQDSITHLNEHWIPGDGNCSREMQRLQTERDQLREEMRAQWIALRAENARLREELQKAEEHAIYYTALPEGVFCSICKETARPGDDVIHTDTCPFAAIASDDDGGE